MTVGSLFIIIIMIIVIINQRFYYYYRKVMVDDLMRAITTVDPEIDNEQLYPTLFWAYRCETREELNDANLLPLDELEQRLINGAIKRVGSK